MNRGSQRPIMRIVVLAKLALRNLHRQRRRSALALAILFAGTVTVLLTRAWQTGMMEMIAREGAGTWVGGAQLVPQRARDQLDAFGLDTHLAVTAELAATLRATPGVDELTPRIRFLGKVFHGDDATPFVGMAMDLRAVPRVLPGLFDPARLVDGRAPRPDRDEVLVAASLAAILDIHPGDRLTLLARPLDGGLEGVEVQVAGILSGAFEEELRRAVVLDWSLAQRILRMPGQATEILLGIRPIARVSEVVNALSLALAPRGLVALGYEDIKPRWRDARALWAMSLRLVFAIVLAVALLGLHSTVTLMVGERARELGTLQALGIRRRWALALLLVEAAILGALGGALGAATAWGVVAALADGIPFSVPGAARYLIIPALSGDDVLAAIAASAIVIVVTTFRPARRLARQPPTVLLA